MLVKSRRVGHSRVVSLPRKLHIKGYPVYNVQMNNLGQVVLTPKDVKKDPFDVPGLNYHNFRVSMERSGLNIDQGNPLGREGLK